LFGASGASNVPAQAAVTKPADSSAQKSNRPLPKAPSSQTTSMTSESTQPCTPAKGITLCFIACLNFFVFFYFGSQVADLLTLLVLLESDI